MHYLRNLKNKFGKHGSKIVLSLFVIVCICSPLGQIPFAQADDNLCHKILPAPLPGAASVYSASDTQPLTSNGSCPSGYGMIPDNTDSSWSTSLAEGISYVVYIFTVGLGSAIAYIASYFFNFSVFISLNSAAYALDFITIGWTTVRDIANMAFIFILIYIGAQVMLQAETKDTMHYLVNVIVVALLINFSFFFARVVIDGGNILAVQFYNAIPTPTLEQAAANQAAANKNETTTGAGATVAALTNFVTGSAGKTKDLTAGIMNGIDVQNILNTDSFKAFAASTSFFTKVITLSFVYICVGVIFGLLAAMFFTIGVKFMSRVVVLWLVIIAAPLALVLYAVPNKKANTYYHQWQDALVTFAFYPAIMLFLFFIIAMFSYGLAGCSIQKIQAISCDPQASIISAAFGSAATVAAQSSSNTVSILASVITEVAVRLGFILILMYFAIKASDIVSSWGGELAQRITAKPDKWAASLAGLSRRITMAPTRLTGSAARQTAGFGWRNTGGWAATKANNALKRSEWANTPGTLGGVIGYQAQKNILEPIAGSAIPGTASYKGRKDYLSKRSTEMEGNLVFQRDKEAASRATDQIAKNLAAGNKAENGVDPKDIDRIQNINESRMKALAGSEIKALANIFNESQMKVADKLDKLNEQDKETARKNFDLNSPHSPLRQARKAVEELRDLNTKLGGLPALTAQLAGGLTIDENAVKNIRLTLDKEHKSTDKQYEDARLAGDTNLMSELSERRRLIRSSIDQDLKNLEEKRKAIRPRNEGGVDKKGGEFTTV